MDDVIAPVEAALVSHFGQRPQRASVSFVGVEPVDVLRFEPVPGERAYVSSGMSRHPMVGADEMVRSADGPRAELMLHLQDPADRFTDIAISSPRSSISMPAVCSARPGC